MKDFIKRKRNDNDPMMISKIFKLSHYFRKHLLLKDIFRFIVGFCIIGIPLIVFINIFYFDNFNPDNYAYLYHDITTKGTSSNLNLILTNINITNSTSMIFVFLTCLFIYNLLIFLKKFNELLMKLELFSWDLRTLGALLDNFILLAVLLFISIKINLIVFDIQFELKEKSTQVFSNNEKTLTLLIKLFNTDNGDKYYEYFNSISTYMISYCSYTIIKNLVFLSHHLLCKIIFAFSSLCFFITVKYFNSKANILLVSFSVVGSYVFYNANYAYEKFKTKALNGEFYFNRVLDGFSILGVIILYASIVKISFKTEYEIDDLNTNIKFAVFGIYLIIMGLSHSIGKNILSFVMYPIEKRYFIYKNNELGKFIKRIPLRD